MVVSRTNRAGSGCRVTRDVTALKYDLINVYVIRFSERCVRAFGRFARLIFGGPTKPLLRPVVGTWPPRQYKTHFERILTLCIVVPETVNGVYYYMLSLRLDRVAKRAGIAVSVRLRVCGIRMLRIRTKKPLFIANGRSANATLL